MGVGGPNPRGWCPYRKRSGHTFVETRRERGHKPGSPGNHQMLWEAGRTLPNACGVGLSTACGHPGSLPCAGLLWLPRAMRPRPGPRPGTPPHLSDRAPLCAPLSHVFLRVFPLGGDLLLPRVTVLFPAGTSSLRLLPVTCTQHSFLERFVSFQLTEIHLRTVWSPRPSPAHPPPSLHAQRRPLTQSGCSWVPLL